MQITLYQHRMANEAFEAFMDQVYEIQLRYKASELMDYGISDPVELDRAVRRGIQVCRATSTPVKEHFKPVYIADSRNIVCDWRLSSLGRKLVVLNANPSNPLVAKLQLKFVKNLI